VRSVFKKRDVLVSRVELAWESKRISKSEKPISPSGDLKQLNETFAILDVAFRQNVPAASFRYYR
jgi:hypothetical protein